MDPYPGQRAAAATGTVFARLLARYKFLLNRPVRLVFIWRDEAQQETRDTRHYLIDKIDKTATGYTLTGVDPLKRLMDTQLVLPRAKLAVAIPETGRRSPIQITLDNASTFNPAGGFARIGDEVFSYTGISGNSLAGVAKTDHGSREKRACKVGDTVLDCVYWHNQNPMDVLVGLFARANASQYLDMDYVVAQRDKWLSSYRFTAIIPTNTSVLALMNEIVQQTVIAAVFDERRQKIMTRVVAPPRRAPGLLFATGEDGNARSLTYSDTLKDYASTVRIYYAMRNVVEGGDESANYAELALAADGDFSGDVGFAHDRAIAQYSRWYPHTQTTQVRAVANLILKHRRAGVHRVGQEYMGEFARDGRKPLGEPGKGAVAIMHHEAPMTSLLRAARQTEYPLLVEGKEGGIVGVIDDNRIFDALIGILQHPQQRMCDNQCFWVHWFHWVHWVHWFHWFFLVFFGFFWFYWTDVEGQGHGVPLLLFGYPIAGSGVFCDELYQAAIGASRRILVGLESVVVNSAAGVSTCMRRWATGLRPASCQLSAGRLQVVCKSSAGRL